MPAGFQRGKLSECNTHFLQRDRYQMVFNGDQLPFKWSCSRLHLLVRLAVEGHELGTGALIYVSMAASDDLLEEILRA